MGGYLDTYGVGEEKRANILRKILVVGGAALAVALILWFVFTFVIPNGRERGEVTQFFQLLQAHDYKQAYALFGCTDAKPCREYPMKSFMEDWGPQAVPVSTFAVLDGESCGSGVIVTVDAGKLGDKKLWVEKKSDVLSSLPPDMARCPQGNRIYDFVRSIRYKLHGRTFQE